MTEREKNYLINDILTKRLLSMFITFNKHITYAVAVIKKIKSKDQKILLHKSIIITAVI